MLLIFDNDGTICDTQQVEGRCYAMAIERVTGLSLSSVDWNTFHEPTSSAIVRPWDVRVCSELGIPMIGIGCRWEQLRELGVRFAFRDYSDQESIMSALNAIRVWSGKS